MKLGEDVIINKFSEIRNPALVEVGNHVGIDFGFYCTTALKVGDYVHIGPYCSVIGGKKGLLTMDHFSGLSAGVRIICSSDELAGKGLANPLIPDKYRDRIISLPVIIKKYAIISTNAVILPGVTIGEGCVIGANALVTKNTEDWTVCVGSPAKSVKMRPKEIILRMSEEMGY